MGLKEFLDQVVEMTDVQPRLKCSACGRHLDTAYGVGLHTVFEDGSLHCRAGDDNEGLRVSGKAVVSYEEILRMLVAVQGNAHE